MLKGMGVIRTISEGYHLVTVTSTLFAILHKNRWDQQ